VNAAADIIDTSHVDAAFANAQRADEAARRRRLIAISGIATLLGGIGIGALCYGASFLMVKARTEVIEVPTVYTKTELIEVPTVYETAKCVVTDKLVEVPPGSKVSEATTPKPASPPPPPVKVAKAPEPTAPQGDEGLGDLTSHGSAWPPLIAWCQARSYSEHVCDNVVGKPAPPARTSNAGLDDFLAGCEHQGYTANECIARFASGGPGTQSFPPAKVPPAKVSMPDTTPVTRPWNTLIDKKYVGRITDVINGAVCIDDDTLDADCIHVALTDGNHHAVLDANGNPQVNPDFDLSPMTKWIGRDAYKAAVPEDPSHLSNFWAADGTGNLTRFEHAPKGQQASTPSTANADSVPLQSDGQSLNLEVGLGARTYTYMLDTGASDMTVTRSIADHLVLEGHAIRGESIPVVLADGSRHTEPTIVIDRVTVGTHTVENVVASVSSDNGMMLLGLSVLNRIGPFTVDAPHLTLTFNGAAS
jgi:clan AA aspartic protease (TIGR02281 family)